MENKKYYCLDMDFIQDGKYKLTPIRPNHKQKIRKWRNEQLYHLRQTKKLSVLDQNLYFNDIIEKQFDQKNPDQILFSFYYDEIFIAYGGLVHINWIDKNAEISFVIDTKSQKKHFKEFWNAYLKLIEIIAFEKLNLHKIYIYSFNLRPELYEITDENLYLKEAQLKEHIKFNGDYIDAFIHSKKRLK